MYFTVSLADVYNRFYNLYNFVVFLLYQEYASKVMRAILRRLMQQHLFLGKVVHKLCSKVV